MALFIWTFEVNSKDTYSGEDEDKTQIAVYAETKGEAVIKILLLQLEEIETEKDLILLAVDEVYMNNLWIKNNS